jgi:hypothetical protein
MQSEQADYWTISHKGSEEMVLAMISYDPSSGSQAYHGPLLVLTLNKREVELAINMLRSKGEVDWTKFINSEGEIDWTILPGINPPSCVRTWFSTNMNESGTPGTSITIQGGGIIVVIPAEAAQLLLKVLEKYLPDMVYLARDEVNQQCP